MVGYDFWAKPAVENIRRNNRTDVQTFMIPKLIGILNLILNKEADAPQPTVSVSGMSSEEQT